MRPAPMEPVTHFLTGACLGRAGFNRKTAYATLAMTLAAEAPDLDVFWNLRGPVAGFQHHRGITHTFIAAPVIALITVGVVWLIHRMRKKPPAIEPRWALLWLFSLVAALSHLLLDYTNNYGLRPFFPFNPHWYARSIVFIFDPVIFLALLASFFMPWIFGLADREIGARRTHFRGRGWSIAALVFIVLWWSLRNAEHAHAIELVRNGDYVSGPITRIDAEPSMLNPFAWRVIAETQDYYRIIEVNTSRDEVAADSAATVYKPEVTPAVAAAKQSYLGRVYLDWSQFPLTTDIGNAPAEGAPPPRPEWHTVEFQDLRFDLIPGSENRNVLAGWVYIGPDNQVEAMYMGGREQK
ncbi:MAG: metal-dependent hydrolase [Acidobacteriaceae bacterium]